MQRMSKMKNMRTALLFLLVAMISLSVSAQNVTVKGTVKDKTGETVIGASVVQKGNTGNGTITDIDGNFTLSVPANSTLVISYVGMKTQEIALKGQTKINVVLDDDSQALDEVVVIGYGTVQKKDLTGSVASVSAKQLSAVPVSNASEALQGKMAGVQITQTEGSPDADIRIRVRGGGSLSQDNSPLYIVDGFPVSSIGDIAPSDIQSVDVLKDASSTAIYGARGANGVIIITTKSGKEGKIEVNAGVSFGIRKMAKHIDVMDPYNYVLYQYELVGGQDCSYGDWQDLDDDTVVRLNAKLTADIDLGGESWTPIGEYNNGEEPDEVRFGGYFDGQGHVIKGLNVQPIDGRQSYGLFGYVAWGVVKNLGIVGGTVTSKADDGPL